VAGARRRLCLYGRADFAGICRLAFNRMADGSLLRYAAGVGMIWGLFLGTAVMGFSLALVTLIQIARLMKKKSEAENRS
jgi:hypothetical protein